ncbi:MAG: STT3 domain-containing protein [bacterium]
MDKKDVIDFFKDKRVQWALVGLILLIVLVLSVNIRTSNLDLLKDQTSGENIPLALDPFYFLRLSETIVEQGSLGECDSFRVDNECIGYSKEITPYATIFLWKIWNVFGDYSLQYVNVVSPVIFFVLGLISFFFLVYFLTNSKAIGLLASTFLAFTSSYLYRTMAGFSDHESIGMFAFFIALLIFVNAMKFHNKDYKWAVGFGLLTGLATAFTIASWGGIAKFLFMIFPLAFFIYWLINKQNIKGVVFYFVWIISLNLFSRLFNFSIKAILNKYLFSSTGLISVFVLGFIIIDFILIKKKFKIINEKYRVLYSFSILVLIGFILLLISGNLVTILLDISDRVLHPFSTERVSLTVAENAQPYLNDWISQTGKVLFWLFFGGLILFGISLSNIVKTKKEKVIFSLFWILMVLGIIFSRISSENILNGTNFISLLFYIGSILTFFVVCLVLYLKKRFKSIDIPKVIIFSWTFFMLIGARGAARLFFAITPFVAFMAGYFIIKIILFTRTNKEDVMKVILWGLVIFSLVGGLISLSTNYTEVSAQAKYTGPSANQQWQSAMSWVRENTNEDSIFAHWWDYGYWVQYLGKRATIADGGHFQTSYGDHFIGRYLLTTPKPETALSLMKTYNVTHLLIDPTDLGKYSAFSKIGSGEEGIDRYSWIPIMSLNPSQIQETSTGSIRTYEGGSLLDEDIMYDNNGSKIFLPRQKAVVIGFLLEDSNGQYKQPTGIYYYNNVQYRIPIRYLQIGENFIDFGSGINSTIKLIPAAINNAQGLSIKKAGAAIYLSPKVSEGLFAKLYLLDDPFNEYPTINIIKSQLDPVVQSLQQQNALSLDDEFVFYSGFRGPIKIFSIDYPENIITHEEFFSNNLEEFGELDSLDFIR